MYSLSDLADPVNASNNWWGSADLTSAYSRLHDQRRHPLLMLIDIEPILTESTMDCSGVANCSDRGECVSPNRCRCNTGSHIKATVCVSTLLLPVHIIHKLVAYVHALVCATNDGVFFLYRLGGRVV